MPWTFEPSNEIRKFDARALEGLDVEIECEHTDLDVNDKKTYASDQYVRVKFSEDSKVLSQASRRLFHVSGWAGKVLGEKGQIVRRIIRQAALMQASNGGRGDDRKYASYAEYFNDARKQRLAAKRGAGLLGAILMRGEDDRADIWLAFDDLEISDSCWEMRAPQEWYSEQFRDLPKFRFADGFYADAANAIIAFQQKHHDDMFGERYFPTLVFPVATPQEKMREIIWRPKVTSEPIVTEQWIIFGTRCKPHEYEEVIENTYAAGGKVPIGVEWDW